MPVNIGRRELIAALGSAATWPLMARAQQPTMPVIGLLETRSPVTIASRLCEFRQHLKETRYIEGENFAFAVDESLSREGVT